MMPGRPWWQLPVAAVLLATCATASTFLPWGRSGTTVRNSYALIDVADRAGVLPHSLASASVAWVFVPFLCGLTLVALSLGRVRWACIASATLGVLVTVGAVLVVRSPLATEPGAILGAIGGTATVLVGAIALITTTSEADR